MTIRILADREPYASYAARGGKTIYDKGPSGPFVILSGPEPLDGPRTDLLAMPAEDFLALPPGHQDGSLVIAYGTADSMESAFERGCADFLREPWPLHELLVRAGKILNPRISIDGIEFTLAKDRLCVGGTGSVELTEKERKIARLLMHNAGLPVTREALHYALYGKTRGGTRAIDNHISSLRKKMDQVYSGAGKTLTMIRGVGYRLT